MIDQTEKYKRTGKGFYPIEQLEPAKKHIYPEGCFNPDQSENWLFKDDKAFLEFDIICKNCNAVNDYNKDLCINCNSVI